MLFINRVLIGDQERVILTRNGRFAGILGPGEHWIFGLGVAYERHTLTDPAPHQHLSRIPFEADSRRYGRVPDVDRDRRRPARRDLFRRQAQSHSSAR